MGLAVTFVSGPRSSGKSAVVRMMLDNVWDLEPHYVRLAQITGSKPRGGAGRSAPASQVPGVASARFVEYTADNIFEVLPAALTNIHRQDRYGAVLIEADADPILRCAYPYDYRIFVMPVPATVREVFRETEEAAREFRRVLDDTHAFAAEIFGLFGNNPVDDREPREERPDMSDTLMSGFLHTPLGDELATRIQLQPTYHGLLESDVIIINNALGTRTGESDECIGRIRHLLERLSGVCEKPSELFNCNPQDPRDKVLKQLLRRLKPMAHGGS